MGAWSLNAFGGTHWEATPNAPVSGRNYVSCYQRFKPRKNSVRSYHFLPLDLLPLNMDFQDSFWDKARLDIGQWAKINTSGTYAMNSLWFQYHNIYPTSLQPTKCVLALKWYKNSLNVLEGLEIHAVSPGYSLRAYPVFSTQKKELFLSCGRQCKTVL